VAELKSELSGGQIEDWVARMLSPDPKGVRRGDVEENYLRIDSKRALWIATPYDTAYVATADEDTACSLIQSLYEGFGSGVVVLGTGVTLQNRDPDSS
jgi:gamma-glutamyltranspeptidase/glutathione hydrolase